MTQEDKKLILKDLCARLHYGVKVTWDEKYPLTLNPHIYAAICGRHDFSWKPYLRPISSMTEEEMNEYKHFVAFSGNPTGSANFISWLNAHHFDYRGLIEKGLAIKVTEENNPYT